MAGYGSLPVIRGGLQGVFGLVGPWFRADFGLLYWAPRAVRPLSPDPRAGVRLQQAGLSGRACLSPRIGSVTPSTCGGLEGGLAWGRGVEIAAPATTTLPWLTASAGLEVAWLPHDRIGAFVGVDALFNAVRPSVQIAGLSEDVQIRAVGVRALLGLAIRFPRNSSDAAR